MPKPEFIVLEKRYHKDGRYAGMVCVLKKTLTPQFLAMIRADKDDVHGWKKHRKRMKELGYDLE